MLFLRDGPAGLEVLMLRRNERSGFVGGAHLFPGGAVDAEDASPELAARCEGRTDADASHLMGTASGGLATWVAAVREAYEEAGLLLARPADRVEEVRHRHRAAVDAGRRSLLEVCEEADLRLALDELRYFSRWTTPVGQPRRYRTRFFLAPAPDGQDASADGVETVAHDWYRPADALARHHTGEIELIFPTYRSLVTLAPFSTAGEVLEAADAAQARALAGHARFVADHDGERIPLPGDDDADLVPAAR